MPLCQSAARRLGCAFARRGLEHVECDGHPQHLGRPIVNAGAARIPVITLKWQIRGVAQGSMDLDRPVHNAVQRLGHKDFGHGYLLMVRLGLLDQPRAVENHQP